MNKKLMVSLLAIAGLFLSIGYVRADSYFTTTSSGIMISSGTTTTPPAITIERVIISSGPLGTYVLLIDTKPLGGRGTVETTLDGVSPASFPNSQWLTPPIEYTPSTSTITSGIFAGYREINVGYGVRNGLVLVQSAIGGTVTIVYSRRKPIAAYEGKIDDIKELDRLVQTSDGKPVEIAQRPPQWLIERGYVKKNEEKVE